MTKKQKIEQLIYAAKCALITLQSLPIKFGTDEYDAYFLLKNAIILNEAKHATRD